MGLFVIGKILSSGIVIIVKVIFSEILFEKD